MLIGFIGFRKKKLHSPVIEKSINSINVTSGPGDFLESLFPSLWEDTAPVLRSIVWFELSLKAGERIQI